MHLIQHCLLCHLPKVRSINTIMLFANCYYVFEDNRATENFRVCLRKRDHLTVVMFGECFELISKLVGYLTISKILRIGQLMTRAYQYSCWKLSGQEYLTDYSTSAILHQFTSILKLQYPGSGHWITTANLHTQWLESTNW